MRFRATCFVIALCASGLAGPACICAQTPMPPLRDMLKAFQKGEPDKSRFLHWASEGYLAEGAWLDSFTTTKALEHPIMAYRTDGSFLMRYEMTEEGWARFLGKRNAFAVTTANVALDAGVGELSRRLYRRGGRWRIAAMGVELYKATSSTFAGVHNARTEAGIDANIRKWTGYHGAIVWR